MTKVSSIVTACVGTALAASLGFASKGNLTPINPTDFVSGYARVSEETKELASTVSFTGVDGANYTAKIKDYFEEGETPGPTHEDEEGTKTSEEDKDDEAPKEEEPPSIDEDDSPDGSNDPKVNQAQSILGVIAVVAVIGIAGLLAVMFFKKFKKKAKAAK